MRIVIDISKDRYDEIMSMDWKNCRRFFDEEIRAIHDGKALEQEPCEDCLFKNEWQKIGKLISVILEKQTEQEPTVGHWIMHDRHRECSKCGVWLLKDMPRNSYCPNCGAKMEG